MLSNTFRWGSSPKLWNTIPILWRRMSISSLEDFSSRSSSSSRTSPWLGSTRRDRQRTTVDLPDPDNPMMTKISPTWTSKLTSTAAGMAPSARMRNASSPAGSVDTSFLK